MQPIELMPVGRQDTVRRWRASGWALYAWCPTCDTGYPTESVYVNHVCSWSAPSA